MPIACVVMTSAKEIKCDNPDCNKTHDYEMLETIKLFGMLCPTCRKGQCSIQHVTVDVPTVNEDIQIPEFDLNLLNSLKIEQPQYASSLSQELDCTYQKVSKRAIKLREANLLENKKETLNKKLGERTYYYLTDEAKKIYFGSNS